MVGRERETYDDIRMLLLEASKLGFEIGYLGHIEGIGWVRRKVRELESRATDLGVLEELENKFTLAKDLGEKKRLGATQIAAPPKHRRSWMAPKLDFEEMPTTLKIVPKKEEQTVLGKMLRIPAAEGISAVANLFKVAEKSHWVMRQVNFAFSGVADLHDVLSNMQATGDTRSILEEGLNMMKETGWITDFEIEEISSGGKMTHIKVISLVPDAYGSGSSPVCKIVSLAIETIATKAFGIPMRAVEKQCICQGEERCRFVIVPK